MFRQEQDPDSLYDGQTSYTILKLYMYFMVDAISLNMGLVM